MTERTLPGDMHPLRPWLMLAAGYSLFFYVFLQRTAPSVIDTKLMRDFDVTAASLSNLSAFYFWSYVVAQIPVGLAEGRSDPCRVLAWPTGPASMIRPPIAARSGCFLLVAWWRRFCLF